jgi:adenylate cyclase
MAEAPVNRRLAAILAADVVGYSRMMATDEAGTLAALKRHREAVFDPTVAANRGRIVKLIGDGTLVEFASVVDAVNCALAIQRTLAGEVVTGPKITLRIGVNLGDIIIDGDDIYGDGVNVAARLEPLAEPGGVCVASIVNESVGNRIDVSFNDAGDVQVKNIDRPIRIWKWSPGDVAVAASKAGAGRPAPVVDAPSIAVLPFANMSGDVEQEYFSDGITDDIITDLSQVGGLLVIARNSSFAYKNRNVDIRAVGRDLGVRSVLEGSVRRAGDRVRITAQLIDTGTGGHLWAARYDRDLIDIFAVQDEVAEQIVAALKVTLSPTEKAQIAEGGTSSLEAYDFVLRGRQLLFGSIKNREVFYQIDTLFRQAIRCDANYSEAYAGLAWAHEYDHHNRWSDHFDRSLQMAVGFADQAIEKGPNEPFARFVAAVIANFTGHLDRARREAETALALNPNYALAHSVRGITDIYAGDPLAAIPRIERGLRLDPGFSQQYLHFLGTAYLTAGKYETAAAQFKQRILLVPATDLSRAFLASALGHLGEFDEAHKVWRDLIAINPKYSFAEHIARLPFKNHADVERITEGLTKAGLPN